MKSWRRLPTAWMQTLGTCFLWIGAVHALLAQSPAASPPSRVVLTLPGEPSPPEDTALCRMSLPEAMKLAGANPLDIALAHQRLQAALAEKDRADVLWLPTLYLGADYARHDGKIQDIVGGVFNTSRSSLMLGAGPAMVFALSDALYQPLSTRQVVVARENDIRTALNDSTLLTAELYQNVQQARGITSGAMDALRQGEALLRRAEQLAPGLIPEVEVDRVRTELARRRLSVESAKENWQVASTELVRVLRLNPMTLITPVEPPHLKVELIDIHQSLDELIPIALTHRPELASRQAMVQATLARLKQEKMRPLIPSLLIRGNATNPAASLSSGYFGGGINDKLKHFGARNSLDVQVLWELQNLGLGNRAIIRQREAENQHALLELFQVQDRVAAEVTRAVVEAKRASARLQIAARGLRYAQSTVKRNIEGLGQTKRAGEVLLLVFRPQEVVAALSALDQAYRDFYGAITDFNRAQFRLYRALGQPADCLARINPPPMRIEAEHLPSSDHSTSIRSDSNTPPIP